MTQFHEDTNPIEVEARMEFARIDASFDDVKSRLLGFCSNLIGAAKGTEADTLNKLHNLLYGCDDAEETQAAIFDFLQGLFHRPPMKGNPESLFYLHQQFSGFDIRIRV